jgi:hypothetical protein
MPSFPAGDVEADVEGGIAVFTMPLVAGLLLI